MRSNDIKRRDSGANKQRMRERTAAEKGMTVEEWSTEINRQRMARQRNRIYGALRRARRKQHDHDPAWLEVEQQRQKQEFSKQMLARYHADPDNWSTRHKRRRLFDRDGWKCRVCGVKVSDELERTNPRYAVAMHIVAKATGGEWTDENMATGCHRCNVADGVNRIPIQTSLLPA